MDEVIKRVETMLKGDEREQAVAREILYRAGQRARLRFLRAQSLDRIKDQSHGG